MGATRRALAVLFAVCVLWAGPAFAQQRVTAEELEGRIRELAAEVRLAQQESGAFGERAYRQYMTGQTALAVLALRAAGGAPEQSLLKAGDYLADRLAKDSLGTYETALAVMALAQLDAERYRPSLESGARRLILWQTNSGGWGYPRPERTDNSNSQFALLGLNAAAEAGVNVPDVVWQGALRYFRAGQRRNGGWGYRVDGNDTYGSMTAAGVASLYLCDLWLHVSDGRCGSYIEGPNIESGLGWLAKHFSVTRNPQRNQWKFYYLYALERAGVILAQRYLAGYDWYREGVEHLVGDPEEMVAAPSRSEWPFLRKCYMLLFLAKGNAPIVIHKAAWQGPWNVNRYDVRWLVRYAAREFERQLDWQIIPLDAPLDQIMAAPILYISGQGRVTWSQAQIRRLQQYRAAGGLILVEAANGDAVFDESFRRSAVTVFPDEELVPLERDHPVYSAYFDIPLAERPLLLAVKGPCWLSALYVPDGLSCPLDVAQFEDVSFRLGANIIAYATGLRELSGKLQTSQYYLPEEAEPQRRRGAFTIGQVVHSGDWRPHKVAWRRVLEQVAERAGIEVYSRPIPVRPGEASPFQGHMLYLTGTREMTLSQQAQQSLRLYVERGGFIFAEAACGSARFDEAFRKLVGELFPGQSLQALPVGHPLLEIGEPIGEVNYSPGVARAEPGLRRLALEHIERDGRTVLVYSRFDISSAIDGHPCYSCPALLQPTAERVAMKIVLYGLTS